MDSSQPQPHSAAPRLGVDEFLSAEVGDIVYDANASTYKVTACFPKNGELLAGLELTREDEEARRILGATYTILLMAANSISDRIATKHIGAIVDGTTYRVNSGFWSVEEDKPTAWIKKVK